MESIKFTNADGDYITIAREGATYRLDTLTGITGLIADTQTQKGFETDGSIYINSLLLSRDIIFSFNIIGQSSRDDLFEQRNDIVRIYNPKLGKGTLVYTNDYTSKTLNVTVDSTPVMTSQQDNMGYHSGSMSVSLTANDPYFLDNFNTSVKLEDFVGGLQFPIQFPISFAEKSAALVIDNDGDVEMPIIAEFRGIATNPILTNTTTGEFIEVTRELLINEKLHIDTGAKTVIHESATGVMTNSFSSITLASTFFLIKKGENTLTFGSDTGAPEVYLTYKRKWVVV